jgi:hypothetical protein
MKICMCVCVCVCVCVRERERERERESERETDKQREDSSAHEDVLFISDTRMTQTSAEEDAKQQIPRAFASLFHRSFASVTGPFCFSEGWSELVLSVSCIV